ncbi:heterokaryon incompatibility protein-domain-containing protein [Apiospora arundinis]|uniref:Heterokaryon incompatibility protein-domain-containing protein n=1 Tax=Apiospora arundinis TaxID=335852 RepID=A0ABR2JMC8_9PEZI
MYHDRDATDPRDRVYAMLGMCSDVHIPDSLQPDYNITWKILFHRLIKYLVGEQALVETWDGKEVAVIRSQGVVLGEVGLVPTEDSGADRQQVKVNIENVRGLQKPYLHWSLQSSALPVRAGDVIILLHDAESPSIVRLHDDYCSVVAIQSIPPEHLAKAKLRSVYTESRDILLLWDWKNRSSKYDQIIGHGHFANNEVWSDTRDEIRTYATNRLESAGWILSDMGKREAAIIKLGKVLEAIEIKHGSGSPQAITAMRNMQKGYGSDFKEILQANILSCKGGFSRISEATLAWLARSYDEKVMELVLDNRGEDVVITEEVAKAAAGGMSKAANVIALLLDRRGNQFDLTEEVTMAGAGKSYYGEQVMAVLLNHRCTVTEEVLKTTAGNIQSGRQIMKLLVAERRGEVIITDKMMQGIPNVWWRGRREFVELLLELGGGTLTQLELEYC